MKNLFLLIVKEFIGSFFYIEELILWFLLYRKLAYQVRRSLMETIFIKVLNHKHLF